MLSWGHASSTGLGFTAHDIVHAHFRACEPEYRWALVQAGIRPGWHVLDAGCGGGSFLPWIAEMVGPAGRVTAIDLAPEHIDRVRGLSLPCPLAARQGNLLHLPYADNTFDAVWCANATQYLEDGELLAALAELRRVVRPHGTIAVKELDPAGVTVRPGDPMLFAGFYRVAGAAPGYARRLMRAGELHRWMRRAGLARVRQASILAERHAPLSHMELSYFGPACEQVARQALALGLGDAWTAFLDPRTNPLHQADGYISEGCVVAVAAKE